MPCAGHAQQTVSTTRGLVHRLHGPKMARRCPRHDLRSDARNHRYRDRRCYAQQQDSRRYASAVYSCANPRSTHGYRTRGAPERSRRTALASWPLHRMR
jgi:hypothetical protein